MKSFIKLLSICAFCVLSISSIGKLPSSGIVINTGNITACGAGISWNVISGTAYYKIKYKVGGVWSPYLNVGNVTSYNFTGLRASSIYTIKVTAFSSANAVLATRQKTITTLSCPTPSGIVVGNMHYNSCAVHWTPASCNISSFSVRYKLTDSLTWTTVQVSNVDSVLLTNLISGRSYDVQVSGGCNLNASSPYSSSFQFFTSNRPNVILVLTDDMTWGNFTPNGGSPVAFMNSPNINRIANEGANFKNTFAVFSLCIPSRGAILTGLYPHNNGATGNQDTLNAGITTIGEIMHDAGYTTGFVGKYHMTAQPQPGWDYWFSFPNVSQYYDPYGNINGVDTVFVGQHLTDVINNLSIYFLDSITTPGVPFFLIMAHVAPHDPFDARQQDDSIFVNTTVPQPTNFTMYTQNYPNYLLDPHHYYQKGFNKNREELRNYYEMLPGIEEGVGMLFNYLDSRGLTDNTLLMFMSDNGYLFGEHKLYRKRLPYEESIKIPLFVRYPAWFNSNTVITNEMALNIDLTPTIMDAAGITNTIPMDGVSLHSLANGSIHRHEFMYEYCYYPDYLNTPSIRAVRDFHYMYIKSYCASGGVEQFFDLQADPAENINQINNSNYSSLISQYRTRLDSFKLALNDTFLVDPNPVACYMSSPVYSFIGSPLSGLDEELEGPQRFIFIYPNPVNEQTILRINYPGFSHFKISISDISGQTVFETSEFEGTDLTDYNLQTSEWPDGNYIVSVISDDQIFKTKLVVIH